MAKIIRFANPTDFYKHVSETESCLEKNVYKRTEGSSLV